MKKPDFSRKKTELRCICQKAVLMESYVCGDFWLHCPGCGYQTETHASSEKCRSEFMEQVEVLFGSCIL